MKNLTKRIVAIGFGIAAGFIINTQVNANQLTFSVEPVMPSNQIDTKVGYFNIKLAPNDAQDLTLKYSNNSKKAVTVNGQVTSAKTNSAGVVDYNAPTIAKDATLAYDMADLVDLPKAVSLDPGETKLVKVHVHMPNESLKGIIAGGLSFNDVSKDRENQSGYSSGLSIKNIYSFQIGLLMRQAVGDQFSDQEIATDGLKLNQVRAGQLNFRNVVNANLQNPLPIFMNQMVIDAQISKKGSSNILFNTVKSGIQMAPNTNFDFPIALGSGVRMTPGQYHIKVTAYSLDDKNGQFKTIVKGKIQSFRYRWIFDKNFTISGNQASKFNKSDVTIKKTDWLMWLLLAIVFLLLLILGILLWYLLKRRDEENVEIEEDIKDLNNHVTTITRFVTQKELKQLLKSGKSVRVIKRHN